MIRVLLLAINKDGVLLMRGVEFIVFGAYLIERSPNLKRQVNMSGFLP
jgi:hypothetical protein